MVVTIPVKSSKSGEFAEGRLWFLRKGSILTIGMTSHGLEKLGALQTIELPEEGEEYTQGDVLTTIEGSGGSLEVVSPVSGAIHEVNGAVEEEPEIAVEDPLEEGWLVKVQFQDIGELEDFISDDESGDSADSPDSDDEDEDSDEESEDDSEESDSLEH